MAKYRQYFCLICSNHAFYPAEAFAKKFCKRCFTTRISHLTLEEIEYATPNRHSVDPKRACIKKKKLSRIREED